VSTDDERLEPDALEPSAATDAAAAAPTTDAGDAASDDAASDDTRAALQDIESRPLAERAPGYQALADRLRSELEQSDPSRGSS
jgi:hypothetical protein